MVEWVSFGVHRVKEPLQDPDSDLVRRARESPGGDYRPFEALVSRYQGKIVANCRYLTRSRNDAEDLAQEVFLKAFFGLKRFEARSSFRTWLQRIKVNHCLNHARKGKGKVFVEVDDPEAENLDELSVEPRAERLAESALDRERIAAILDSMPDTLRIPLILCDLDQMAYQEIADTLGIGLSAVKMRIKRARAEFQARYRRATGAAGTAS